MRTLTLRFIGCLAALMITGLLFWGSVSLWGALLAALWMTFLYVFVRPLLQTILLPFNVLLLGVCTPLCDAWLVWWAGAWSFGGVSMGYGQALLVAILALIFYLPYSQGQKRRLLQ